jgi:hypothetical protein
MHHNTTRSLSHVLVMFKALDQKEAPLLRTWKQGVIA